MTYFAHVSDDKMRTQTLLDHAKETAKLSGKFAAAFGCKEWGYNCGLLHDLGKYSKKFQERLKGGPMCDHATAGAKEAKNIIAAYCIAGHHSGLLDGGGSGDVGGAATLHGRMQKELEDYSVFKDEIQIPVFPQLSIRRLGKGGFTRSFFIRMLFSCLVDGDYLDTERFMTDTKVRRGGFDSIETLYGRLLHFIEPWLEKEELDTINGRRSVILKACLKMGRQDRGLFQLTVPTGGGKTISSLAFALHHAKTHQLDRIIYVVPYQTIIEQNAAVFRKIVGNHNVLEDHCNVVYDDSEELNNVQLASENWDCPIVVTTNVQFFESLFSNKTSRCRKLHNIANSVIIFDEAQMIPVNYLKPCIQAISELVYNYHSTAVLCTATQPSLQSLFPKNIPIREICPDVQGQYEFFRRTTFCSAGKLSEEECVSQLQKKRQVLCILNSRKRVQRVFEALEGEVFHLSTYMYPLHRKQVLSAIRYCLKKDLPCKVVATSLVEAGVDLDFQTVYRELAGIDSVIQAAGRCNREGKYHPESCKTVIFTLEQKEDIKLHQSLQLPVKVAEIITEEQEEIASLEAIEAYFKKLYYFKGEQGLDTKEILEQLEDKSIPFATVANQFQLIETETIAILIDREPKAQNLVKRIKKGECSRGLVREAGQYCINLYKNDFDHLKDAGLLEELNMGFYRLRNSDLYSFTKGLKWKAERGDALWG